mmetsp:Transcript_19476/g.36331  ORF Transcript_19476/g.36331 Transcript_19476/m.36331 type:complete len:80 (+) Transcript_19476:234-473(+)
MVLCCYFMLYTMGGQWTQNKGKPVALDVQYCGLQQDQHFRQPMNESSRKTRSSQHSHARTHTHNHTQARKSGIALAETA